jgi:hypothetical protein
MENNVIYLEDLRIAPTVLVAWKQCAERAMMIEALHRAGFRVRVESTSWGVLEQLEHKTCALGLFAAELEDVASIDVIMVWNMAHAGSGNVHTVYLGGEGEQLRKGLGSIGISTFLRKPITRTGIIDAVRAAWPVTEIRSALPSDRTRPLL